MSFSHCSFMYPVYSIITFPTAKHPNKRTIIKNDNMNVFIERIRLDLSINEAREFTFFPASL